MKRIYSLNLAAYIQMKTAIEPTLDIDYSDGNGLVHCIFPECEGVSAAIREYNVQNFLCSQLSPYLNRITDEKLFKPSPRRTAHDL